MELTTTMLLLLAVGLSMDAFAVSVTNGMLRRIHPVKNALSSGLAFGFFQGLMPMIGFFAGSAFSGVIERVDHWVALLLLGFIGGKMVLESLNGHGGSGTVAAPAPGRVLVLRDLGVQAVATSIDALAVGVGLGVMQVNMVHAVGTIAAVTFVFCFCGVWLGRAVGGALRGKAELLGGMILLFIGVRIFLEHIGVW